MIEIDRKYLVVMMEAGYIYLGMQKFKEAYNVFEGVVAMAPDSDIPLIALGGCRLLSRQVCKRHKVVQEGAQN